MKPLIAELQARANDELDYTLEAEAQHAFAQAFRGDPEIVVPDVVAVGEHVLVTEWLESPASLATVIESGTQEERDHYGELFVRFLFSGPAPHRHAARRPAPRELPDPPERRRQPRPARRPRLRRGRAAARRRTARGDGRTDPDRRCSRDPDELVAGLRTRASSSRG